MVLGNAPGETMLPPFGCKGLIHMTRGNAIVLGDLLLFKAGLLPFSPPVLCINIVDGSKHLLRSCPYLALVLAPGCAYRRSEPPLQQQQVRTVIYNLWASTDWQVLPSKSCAGP